MLSNVKDGRNVPVLNELKCFFESNESNFSGRKTEPGGYNRNKGGGEFNCKHQLLNRITSS